MEHRVTKGAKEEGIETTDHEVEEQKEIITKTDVNTTERPQSSLHVDKAELREMCFFTKNMPSHGIYLKF